MKHIFTLLLAIYAVGCGGSVDPDTTTEQSIGGSAPTEDNTYCVTPVGYLWAYTDGDLATAEPGERVCLPGGRTGWCIYEGSEPANESNFVGPDAVADPGNDDGCAPGFEGVGMGGMGGSL